MREKRGDDRENGYRFMWSSRIGPMRTSTATFAARARFHHICTRHHEQLAILEVDEGEVLEIGVGEERWHR